MKMLAAYEGVLEGHGIPAAEDSHYYRLLLDLSLEPATDWRSKIESLTRKAARCVALNCGIENLHID